jgi:cytochrome c oxidase cbb3-type subunit 3
VALEERDPHTGYLTTGHEWNGIKELNTPVPRVVYFLLIVTAVFSLGYWVLMPAFPLGVTFTKGLLGVDQRSTVSESLQQAASERRAWTERLTSAPVETVLSDARLINIVRQTGRTLFGDNCAACHGLDAKGRPGFPNLTAASPLWGAEPETIAETLRVGINSAHPNTRTSQMLAFGRDKVLSRDEIEKVATYVLSLSRPAAVKDVPPQDLQAGRTLFAANCASCHGEAGKGNSELGAPDLTDQAWIYGGDAESIYASIFNGRQGHMPAWDTRLSALERKILTLYLTDLRRRP